MVISAQLISNTNIAVSADLLDRMQETQRGPELRNWCHSVGLLPSGADFTDKYERGGRISVQLARTFIVNYYRGKNLADKDFEKTETIPVVCARGQEDQAMIDLAEGGSVWKDAKLAEAAKEFVKLVVAQRTYFKGNKNVARDRPEKALNAAVLSAWAFVAGLLHKNSTRLARHFALKDAKGKDPLNANALDKGRHKSDPDNYRGLGFRQEPRERGRFVELFYIQADKGVGVTKAVVDAAIANYHAKQANLEAVKAKEKVG